MWSALPLLLLAAPAAAPEVVVLPPMANDALASQALEAWQVVADELGKAKKKLKVQTSLQKKQHDFLVGPVREQAKDCGEKLPCLAEIGTALGAQVLVIGKLDDRGVGLMVLDVATASPIAEGGSAPALAGQAVKKQAIGASKSLVQAWLQAQKKGPANKKPEANLAKKEPPPPPPPEGGAGTGAAPLLAVGQVAINRDQLVGVNKVTLDGEVVLFAGDGSIRWSGAPGSHRLKAERSDGSSMQKEVVVEPGRTQFVSLEFPIVAPVASASPAAEEGESVTGKWWFWTSLGVAVAAGSATAILLLGGEKGGPQLPDTTGSIRGTY